MVEAPIDALGHPSYAQGAIMPQSRAAMAGRAEVDPQPGERMLDLCAAPGGKTTHLAALIGDAARSRPWSGTGRAAALRSTAERLRARAWRVQVADAEHPRRGRAAATTACSSTRRARPGARWRTQPDARWPVGGVEGLAALQECDRRRRRAPCARWRLVYSTCTLSPRENERAVAAAWASTRPDLR